VTANGDGRAGGPGARPPVFLIGAPRSGTTLLYKALCLHADVAWIPNWTRRLPTATPLSGLNRVARLMPGARRAVWFGNDSNAYVFGARRPFLHRIFPMPIEGEPLFARCGLPTEASAGMSAVPGQQEALRQAFASICRWSGAPVLVNKRIGHNRRIPFLAETFPGARFVELVRDGRAVAYSLSHVDWWEDSPVWWYGGTPARWRDEGREPWRMTAQHWMEELAAIEQGLSAVPPAAVRQVRYEDLISDPATVLNEIAQHAGLTEDRRWQREIGRLQFPDRNEAWRANLDKEVAAGIEAVQRERLLEHGYVA